VKHQPPPYTNLISNILLEDNAPPKLHGIFPREGPSTGGTKVYLYGDISR
jgi:hypothetical protein